MDPAVKSSLLGGAVGALSFLVLIQGYHLVSGEFVGIWVMGGTALVVFAVSALGTHLLRPVVWRWSVE